MHVEVWLSTHAPSSFEVVIGHEVIAAFEKLGVRADLCFLDDQLPDPKASLSLSFSPQIFEQIPFLNQRHLHIPVATRASLFSLVPPLIGGCQTKIEETLLRAAGAPLASYCPIGVETITSYQEKRWERAVIANLIDLDDVVEGWKERFSKQQFDLLHGAIEPMQERTPLQTLQEIALDPCYLGELEWAYQALHNRKMIEQIEGEDIPIFGNHQGRNWYKRLCNASSVRLCFPLPYGEMLTLFQQTRRVLIDHSPARPLLERQAIANGAFVARSAAELRTNPEECARSVKKEQEQLQQEGGWRPLLNKWVKQCG